jgi:hypothetical protein
MEEVGAAATMFLFISKEQIGSRGRDGSKRGEGENRRG